MKYLITGITGSLGTAVAKILDKKEHCELIGYSRDEFKQTQLLAAAGLSCPVTLYLGDVRDRDRLIEASRGVDMLFHFAALKHVDKIEENPEEAIATNIRGTENVMHAQRVNKIPRVVLSATDKGVYPINVYGATKLISERLVLRNPNNIVCRYGNVLASRGSVIPTFINSLKKHHTINLTHNDMTRFWIRLEQAAAFVVESAHREQGGLCIPAMRCASVLNVGKAIAELLSIERPHVKLTGVRAGEKIHESLTTEYEGPVQFEFKSNNEDATYTPLELEHLLRPIVMELM